MKKQLLLEITALKLLLYSRYGLETEQPNEDELQKIRNKISEKIKLLNQFAF